MLLLSIAAAMSLQVMEPAQGAMRGPELRPGEVEFFRIYPSNPYTRATYEEGSIVRDGPLLRARIHSMVLRSGLPDISVTSQVELDCARNLHRTLEYRYWDLFDGGAQRHRTPRAPFTPIAGEGDMFYALASRLCAATAEVWIEFDRRPAGWQESPFEYDAGSVRREGTRVRATYRHKIFLSGLPDPEFLVGIEIDCASRQTRVIHSVARNVPAIRVPASRRRATPRRPSATPIAVGSIEESLAGRLCPDPATPRM